MIDAWPIPCVPAGQVGGHEGVGTVVILGPGTEGTVKIGACVGVKRVANVCGSCGPCLDGRDGLCPNQNISGWYHPGTFQQYVVAQASYLTPIPEGLSPELAAPMLCAGVTTYAALRKANTRGGQWIVVSGAGGGLGHIAVQLAKNAFALRVIGIDVGDKESFAKECGAEKFIDLTKLKGKSASEEVYRITGGEGAHAVVICTGNNTAYAQGPDMLRFGGTMVCVGLPGGPRKNIEGLSPGKLIDKELSVVGSLLGSKRDAVECLDFAARGAVKIHVEVRGMNDMTKVCPGPGSLTLLQDLVTDHVIVRHSNNSKLVICLAELSWTLLKMHLAHFVEEKTLRWQQKRVLNVENLIHAYIRLTIEARHGIDDQYKLATSGSHSFPGSCQIFYLT